MPKVTYRGPTHELIVGDKVLLKDGDAVELTRDEMVLAGSASVDTLIEVDGSAPPATPVQVPVENKTEG
jgi:hypothetical protein